MKNHLTAKSELCYTNSSALKKTLNSKEGDIGTKSGERRGRKRLPPGEKKEGVKVYLRKSLVEWYLKKGHADNLTQALENIAGEEGYTEESNDNKISTAGRRSRRTNLEPSTCATELNQAI